MQTGQPVYAVPVQVAESPAFRLLHGEQILHRSKSGRLTLTTHRLRFESQGVGFATIKSIMLEKLASCAVLRERYPVLLMLAVIFLFAGILVAAQVGVGAFLGGLVVALVLVLIYFGSQQQVVRLASAGATITIHTSQMTIDEVRDLFDRIEAAKNARYLSARATK